MNKQILDQVNKAMQAQHDTIARQAQMLDQKDQDIASLTASLTELAQTQTQQAKELPASLEKLSTQIEQLLEQHRNWSQTQTKILDTQVILTKV